MATKVKILDVGIKEMSQCMLEALRMAVDAEVVKEDPFRNDSMDFIIRNYRADIEEVPLDKGHWGKHKNHLEWYHGKRRY